MTAVYKPGQVAAALFAKKKSSNVENNPLVNLFAGTKTPKLNLGDLKKASSDAEVSRKRSVVSDNASEEKLTPKAKKQKKKNEKNPPEKSASLVPEPSDFPFQHESLTQKKEPSKSVQKEPKKKVVTSKRKLEDELAEKRPRRNRQRDRSADPRTIFIGNCPLSADKKVLKRLFKEYGEIESVRFRCAPAAQPDLPRRATVITKNFHEKCKSYIGYIVFKEEESAEKAVEKNGYVLDDLHLRVDIAASAKKHDKKKSLFVGNLPFDVNEDEIRSHFADCGDITNVRIVRDRQTSIGKGIAFLQFESKDCVGLALKLNGSEFQGRHLRAMACTNKAKKKEEKKKKETGKKDTSKEKGKKKMSFAPSNLKSSSFKSKLQNKKEKRLRKLKKKTKAKKTDQITAILGEAPVIPAKTKPQKKTNAKSGPKKGLAKGQGKRGGMKGNKGGKSFKKRK